MSAMNDAYNKAANRLHHLSMRYAGAMMELVQGKKVGLIPANAPGFREARDFIDLILLTRAEINGLSNLLVKKKILTQDEMTVEFTEQYEWLTTQKAQQLQVVVTDFGLQFDAKREN